MPAQTVSMTAGRPLRRACGYQPPPYVLLQRSAGDVPVVAIPKTKGLRAVLQALRALFKHWVGHDRTRVS